MKKAAKIIAGILVFMSLNTVNAMASENYRSDSTYTYYGKSSYYTKQIKPIYDTQTYHNANSSVSIGVSSSTTTSTAISGQVTIGSSAVVAKIESSIGITETISHTVGTSVVYTLDRSNSAGWYRIETVYPGDHAEFKKWRNSDGRCMRSQSINYAPEANQAYGNINHN